MNAPLPDLALCAQEPIRVPGAIQPHGWMAVLAGDGRLAAWSANWRNADRAAEAVSLVRERLAQLQAGDAPAAIGRIDLGGAPLDVIGHRSGEHTVLEIEAAGQERGTQAPIYSLARHFLPQLQKADSLEALAELPPSRSSA